MIKSCLASMKPRERSLAEKMARLVTSPSPASSSMARSIRWSIRGSEFKHPFNAARRTLAHVFFERNNLLGPRRLESIAHFLERIHLHVGAKPAAADEVFFRRFHLQPSDD